MHFVEKHKRLLSIIFSLIMLVNMLPAAALAAEPAVSEEPAKPALEAVAEDMEAAADDPEAAAEEDTQADQTVDVSGTINWVNADQQDSGVPETVTLTLYANGVATGTTLTVDGPSGSESDEPISFSFTGLDAVDQYGYAIKYTVSQETIDDYETIYSADTLTITNSYIGEVNTNHTFSHIDVRIEGAELEIQFVVKDPNGVVISQSTKTIECSVTNVEYVVMNGTTYTDFDKSGTYEYRKMNLRLSVDEDSSVVLVVDLVDADGNTYNDVAITMTAGGIMDAAYECNGFGNRPGGGPGGGWGSSSSFDGLDFIIGKAQNYKIEYVSTGLAIEVQKYIETNGVTEAFSGVGGEFSFLLEESLDGEVLRTWTVTNDADGKATFAVVYEYDNETELKAYDGKVYTYTIKEVAGNSQYTNDQTVKTITVTMDVQDTENGGATLVPQVTAGSASVSFTNVLETVAIAGSKTWDDANDQDGLRPDYILVHLLANGEVLESKQVSEADGWAWDFGNLPKYDADHEEILYTISETAVSGYETVIDGYNITNTHIPAVVSVSGIKTWNDADDQDGARPESITIELLGNGTVVRTLTVTAADGWAWRFENLPKFEAGVEIAYSLKEISVDGYSTTYNGYNIINEHTPEQTSVTVSKVWDDNGDQDGLRPNDVTVILLANGVTTGETLVLSEGNNWTGSFTELDKYAAGEVITYTVQEIAVAGYETVITGDQTAGYTITNTHTPETLTVAGSKTWDDNDNQDGFRPESITVKLWADGVVIQTVTVTEADGWAWSFNDLPKYRNHGEEIEYGITEDAVEHYSTTYDGYDITNSHTPEQISISVNKSWNDNDDQDGIRAEEITVVLLANGIEQGKTLTLNAGNNWTGSFTELDKYAHGREIVYTVQEIAVDGYETVITGDHTTGYTIVNTHIPETVTVSGSKTWNDADDQDGFRPESITVNLLADGEIIDTVTVTAEDWSWSFEDLPKYRNHGVEIVYSVTEEAVGEYSTSYDGYDIINDHTPEQTSVTVSKVWADNDDQDGIRPEFVTVVLLANGEATGETLVLSEENAWTGSFTELDKYAAGEVITYTVQEIAIEGYATVITGDQTAGYTVTNSHNPETLTVAGSKTWIDNDNQDGCRPESITVNLLADGEIIDTVTVTAEDWSWSFENLPKYRDHGVEIVYSVTENAVEGYSTSYDGYDITNTHAPEKTSVTVSKIWNDADNQDGIRPNDVTVILLANGEDTGKTLILSTGNSWTGSFTELDKYENGEIIDYTVQEITVADYETAITGDQTEGYTITNTHTPETVTVAGSKTWDDNNDQDGFRPDSITVHLWADGEKIDTKVVTSADWSWSFENLPKYRDQGTLIVYSITEDAVDNYVTTYNRYDITNTHAPEKTSVTVNKVWADSNNQDGIRVNDVTVILLANGEATGKNLILNSGNSWTGSFTDLDKYENGEIIVYTVQEITVAGYETVISGDQNTGYTITNSHTPETVTVAGSKTWDDNNDQDGFRPESITVNLLADGTIIDTVTVTGEDWSWSFENLPKYRDHGVEIIYTITEDAVEDYVTTYNRYDITNTHAPEKTSVTVNKVWADSNNQDGIRANDITVVLLANGEATGKTLVLNSGNSWTGSFTDLDKYENGEIIVYTVQEITVAGYETVISGDQNTGYTITNSHTPETVTVAGSKTWDDNNDQDGFRPESITVHLWADGVKIDTKVVTAEDWSWSFENLPKYRDEGTLIVYSITEDAVVDYVTTYNGYDITNSHAPEKISVTVNKAWADSNNQDGIRPNEVTVILLADGQPTEYSLVLNASNNWTGSFTDLDKYAAGVEIVYTVQELTVYGYETVISGDQYNGYTVTNSHTPETLTVAGSKTWDDNNDQDGFRPESITVNLLADGVVINTITVTEADGWAWSFVDLPKYRDQGIEILYSVTENAVEDYSTSYDGYDITNTHAPEKTSVTVSKVWADNDDQDGIRPDAITVILLADGEATEYTLVLNADNNWTGSFTELDKYAAGVEIVYTVQEISVAGYETVISGDQTVGYTITNSHNPETVTVAGSKTWDDNDNQDGIRPESITVNLLADGVKIDTVTVTGEDWSWIFENLPKYRDHGVEIIYTIVEDAVEGYVTTYDGYDVINSYSPEEISITVTKVWDDADDAEGKRADEVIITLYANGVLTDLTLTLNAEGNWTGTFANLPKYEQGVEIVYTIGEVAVEGYTTAITGDMTQGFVVTNTIITVPKTGDMQQPMLLLGMMVLSAMATAYLVVDNKKRTHNR